MESTTVVGHSWFYRNCVVPFASSLKSWGLTRLGTVIRLHMAVPTGPVHAALKRSVSM